MNTKLVIILIVVFALFNLVSFAQGMQTYTTTDGSFTITYPAAWDGGEGVFEQQDLDGRPGFTRLVISTKSVSGMLIYPATGDGIIAVQLPPPSFWIRGSPPIPNTLDEVFDMEYQNVDKSGLQVTKVTFGEMEAIRVYTPRTFDGYEFVNYLVRGGPQGFYSMTLTTISGEVALYDVAIQQMITSMTFTEIAPLPEVTETPSELVVRTLDRGEYKLELIFDPATCTLVNGGDLVVLELEMVRQLVDSLVDPSDQVIYLIDYLWPNTGSVEMLRLVVENEMFNIKPECIAEDKDLFRYRIGNTMMDSSSLGNIAYGYFLTRMSFRNYLQEAVADVAQRINTETRERIRTMCGEDYLCYVRNILGISDNCDDRVQWLIGQSIANLTDRISLRLLEQVTMEQTRNTQCE